MSKYYRFFVFLYSTIEAIFFEIVQDESDMLIRKVFAKSDSKVMMDKAIWRELSSQGGSSIFLLFLLLEEGKLLEGVETLRHVCGRDWSS